MPNGVPGTASLQGPYSAAVRPTIIMCSQGAYSALEGCQHVLDYLRLCEEYPVPIRMVKGHVHRMVRLWVQEAV